MPRVVKTRGGGGAWMVFPFAFIRHLASKEQLAQLCFSVGKGVEIDDE